MSLVQAFSMMGQLKNYFFNKAVETAKQSLTSAKKAKKQLLCVMEVAELEASQYIEKTNTHFKNAGYEIYFLFYWSKLNEKMDGTNVHFYSKKKVSWFGGLTNLSEYDCLLKSYDLVLYPQKSFRKDFEFVSKIIDSNLQVGTVENLEKYNLDLALDCDSSDLTSFYKQLNDYFPRLFSRKIASN